MGRYPVACTMRSIEGICVPSVKWMLGGGDPMTYSISDRWTWTLGARIVSHRSTWFAIPPDDAQSMILGG